MKDSAFIRFDLLESKTVQAEVFYNFKNKSSFITSKRISVMKEKTGVFVIFKGQIISKGFFSGRGFSQNTSHSAYVATETELYGGKIDGLLPSNFL